MYGDYSLLKASWKKKNISVCISLICQHLVSYVYSCLPQVNCMGHQTAHYRDKGAPFPKLDDQTSHGAYCNFSATVHLQAIWGKMLTKHCILAVRMLHGWWIKAVLWVCGAKQISDAF